MAKQTSFQPDWENDPSFSPWLERVKNAPNMARCKLCFKSFSLSNMGKRAVTSHMKSTKHVKAVDASEKSASIKVFFKSSTPCTENSALVDCDNKETVSVSNSPLFKDNGKKVDAAPSVIGLTKDVQLGPASAFHNTNSKSSPRGLQKFVLDEKVAKAEILWAIQSVMTHTSLRTAGKDVTLFREMFPDSEIAQKMQLQRDKIGYIIAFGLGPFFKSELLKQVTECEFVVLGFDESLNKIAQKEQLDVNVRFWHKESGEVHTRYLTSVFLGRTTALDILAAFKEATKQIDLKKILQISMDGPNVNFKFLRDLKEELKAHSNTELLHLGSCGLHTLNNAFKVAMKETGWEIVAFLRALYNIFKDTPARRAIYTSITKSTVFPLKFCAVRWLENVKVAQRALDILPNICDFVSEIKKTNQISSTSYETVGKTVKDPLLPVKLQFFISLATDVEPFLREFQNDLPLAPFVYDSLTSIVRSQMDRVVKPSVLEAASSLYKVHLNNENLLDAKNMKLGIATKSVLKKIPHKITDIDILHFRQDCRKCVTKFIAKMLEVSPLKEPLTRAISSFDPKIVGNNPIIAKKRMESLLTILLDSNWISSSKVDRTLREYEELCNDATVISLFKSYNRSDERIDHFWSKLLKQHKLHNLFHVLKVVCTLSHGNANIERGFSINAECLVENMKEELLIGRRCVYDFVSCIGGLEKLEITKGLIHSSKNAYAKFKEARRKKRLEEESALTEAQRKRVAERERRHLESKRAKILLEAQNEANKLTEQIEHLCKFPT